MAELQKMPRHRRHGGAVVEADARVAAHRVDAPGEHVGPAVALQQREELRIVVDADEDIGVDAVVDHLLGDAQLGLQVVMVLGEHERVAGGGELGLQRARRPGIERVVERRHDRADQLAPGAAQGTRRAVRHIAQLGDGGADAALRVGIDLGRHVERPRHGRRRHAGEARHVLGAGPPRWRAGRVVVGQRPLHGAILGAALQSISAPSRLDPSGKPHPMAVRGDDRAC